MAENDNAGPRSAAVPDPDALVPLRELPALLPLRGGKRVHLATVHRWAQRGVAGVRLRTVSIGAMRCSSLAWVRAWAAEVADARLRADEPTPARRPVRRRRATA